MSERVPQVTSDDDDNQSIAFTVIFTVCDKEDPFISCIVEEEASSPYQNQFHICRPVPYSPTHCAVLLSRGQMGR